MTSPASFENVREKWFPEVHHHCPGVPCLIVGTQTDLRDDHSVKDKLAKQRMAPVRKEDGEKMARELGAVKYVECSALTQYKLKDVFDEVSHLHLHPHFSGYGWQKHLRSRGVQLQTLPRQILTDQSQGNRGGPGTPTKGQGKKRGRSNEKVRDFMIQFVKQTRSAVRGGWLEKGEIYQDHHREGNGVAFFFLVLISIDLAQTSRSFCIEYVLVVGFVSPFEISFLSIPGFLQKRWERGGVAGGGWWMGDICIMSVSITLSRLPLPSFFLFFFFPLVPDGVSGAMEKKLGFLEFLHPGWGNFFLGGGGFLGFFFFQFFFGFFFRRSYSGIF